MQDTYSTDGNGGTRNAGDDIGGVFATPHAVTPLPKRVVNGDRAQWLGKDLEKSTDATFAGLPIPVFVEPGVTIDASTKKEILNTYGASGDGGNADTGDFADSTRR